MHWRKGWVGHRTETQHIYDNGNNRVNSNFSSIYRWKCNLYDYKQKYFWPRWLASATTNESGENYISNNNLSSVIILIFCGLFNRLPEVKKTYNLSLFSLTFCWPCISVYLSQYLTNLMPSRARDGQLYLWWYQRLCNAILTSWWWVHVLETCRGTK